MFTVRARLDRDRLASGDLETHCAKGLYKGLSGYGTRGKGAYLRERKERVTPSFYIRSVHIYKRCE